MHMKSVIPCYRNRPWYGLRWRVWCCYLSPRCRLQSALCVLCLIAILSTTAQTISISGHFVFYHEHHVWKSMWNMRFERLVSQFVPTAVGLLVSTSGRCTVGSAAHDASGNGSPPSLSTASLVRRDNVSLGLFRSMAMYAAARSFLVHFSKVISCPPASSSLNKGIRNNECWSYCCGYGCGIPFIPFYWLSCVHMMRLRRLMSSGVLMGNPNSLHFLQLGSFGCCCGTLNDLSMMYHASRDRKHEGAMRISRW